MSYIIGIDLGTTNCTMASARINKDPEIIQFSIPQMLSIGMEGESYTLSSFLYFPLDQEREKKVHSPKWREDKMESLGIMARERGAELPGRVVSSAKSWLSYDEVKGNDPILPIDAEDKSLKISPLDVIKKLLEYLLEAWNLKNPESPFKQQQIFITVPASFDPRARSLVEEAAKRAGYPEVVLLEEPQAAFYAWLYHEKEEWRKKLNVGDTVLVIDIGGGTTDFSLIEAKEEGGSLILERLAVGDHLLLGGDNMDLALAYLVEQKLEAENKEVEGARFNELVHRCRSAKEELLGSNPSEKVVINIQGKGTKLIGGSLKVELQKEEVLKLLVDGFIPLISPEEQAKKEKKVGLRELGLPYAQDARISAQLARFLSRGGALQEFIFPTHVLFNGGALKAKALQERMVLLLNSWARILNKSDVKLLGGIDLDNAVSIGAVYSGLSRMGSLVRIKAGISRSYFIGIEGSVPAVPGFTPKLKTLCVAYQGMEEGESIEIKDQEFTLLLGEVASFRFFSHSTGKLSNGTLPFPGLLFTDTHGELKELHPIETLLEKGSNEASLVRVTLSAHVSEIGSLQIFCRAEDGRTWKLEFDIRS